MGTQRQVEKLFTRCLRIVYVNFHPAAPVRIERAAFYVGFLSVIFRRVLQIGSRRLSNQNILLSRFNCQNKIDYKSASFVSFLSYKQSKLQSK